MHGRHWIHPGVRADTGLVQGPFDDCLFGEFGTDSPRLANQWYHQKTSFESATAVNVARGAEVDHIDAAMSPVGVITGTVTLAHATIVRTADGAPTRHVDAVLQPAGSISGHVQGRGSMPVSS